MLVGLSAEAQKKKKNLKVAIEVDGVCMMCKKRIEKAALNSKGVKFATWDIKTHKLSLIIDEKSLTFSLQTHLHENKFYYSICISFLICCIRTDNLPRGLFYFSNQLCYGLLS